jgi:hypothetical protein
VDRSKISVSNHAYDRWVERAASFVNEDAKEIISAYLESSKLDKNMVPSQKNNRSDIEHRYHKPTGGVFVAEKRSGGLTKIVTYYVVSTLHDPATTIARDKEKLKSQYRTWDDEVVNRAEQGEKWDGLSFPDFASPDKECRWLKLQKQMHRYDSPEHKALEERHKNVKAEIAASKPRPK